jgi:hypothetical protein
MFRPGKKRKIYRQRPEEEEDATTKSTTDDFTAPATASDAPTAGDAAEDSGDGRSVAEVLRLRNLRKQRHGGVAFRAGPYGYGDDSSATAENSEQSMVLHDSADADDSGILGGITQRFAPQTGLVGELVNKHM